MKLKHRHQSTSYRPDETEISTSSHPIKKKHLVCQSSQSKHLGVLAHQSYLTSAIYLGWTHVHGLTHVYTSHTLTPIIMAGTGMWSQNNSTWRDRDEFYYSSPPYNADTEEAQMHPRFTNMLTTLCGFGCFLMWKQEEKLFCEHNRACCLTCGETWIRFGLEDGHSMDPDNHCTNQPIPSAMHTLSEYRWVYL